jgi:hypothetical protein
MWTSSLVGHLIIGCLVGGIPGAWAWGVSTARGWAGLFQTGPALLILPVFIWTVISHATTSDEVNDWWRIVPFYVTLGVAVLWHLALIAGIKERANFHIVYALLFMPIFYYFCMLSMVLAIRFPL